MENNCLLSFDNPRQYREYLEEIGIYGYWRISSGLMNDRGKLIEEKSYVNILRKIFFDNHLYYKQVSIAEIVSWLDTFVHLNRILNHLIVEQPIEIVSKIQIIIEYKIEMAKLARVDCIIKYNNKYCLLEFRTVNKFEKMKSAYEKKRLELMIYKDLMENYIEYPAKIVVFPFIGLYEFDQNKRVNSHIENNKKTAKYASDYITRYVLNK